MIPKIAKLEPLQNYWLKVTFDDGKTVFYNVSEDIREIPDFRPLRDIYGLFAQARLDQSRTCVYWNDRIDLPSDTLYEYGHATCPKGLMN